jgi:hypothetical protein
VVVAAVGAGGASLQLATARLPSGVNREVFAQQMWVPLDSCALACAPSRELRQLPPAGLKQQTWPPAAVSCSFRAPFQPLPAHPPPPTCRYQWAATLTTNGRNMPFALPLRTDSRPDGFQASRRPCQPAAGIGLAAVPSTLVYQA